MNEIFFMCGNGQYYDRQNVVESYALRKECKVWLEGRRVFIREDCVIRILVSSVFFFIICSYPNIMYIFLFLFVCKTGLYGILA